MVDRYLHELLRDAEGRLKSVAFHAEHSCNLKGGNASILASIEKADLEEAAKTIGSVLGITPLELRAGTEPIPLYNTQGWALDSYHESSDVYGDESSARAALFASIQILGPGGMQIFDKLVKHRLPGNDALENFVMNEPSETVLSLYDLAIAVHNGARIALPNQI